MTRQSETVTEMEFAILSVRWERGAIRAIFAVWAAIVVACWSSTLPAAEETGKKPVTVSIMLEQFPANRSRSWTLPNGKTFGGAAGGMGEIITCDASEVEKAVEAAKRHHAEMKDLIAQKRGYRLLKVYGEEKTGGKLYKYLFTYSDGSQGFKEFSISLEDVKSWDDFLDKRQAEEDERNEKIYRAIVAKRYRLRHTTTRYSFVCQDTDSTEKYRVLFLPGRKGNHRAAIVPFEEKAGEQAAATPRTTSWQEHLQAVRKGERKVLQQETRKTYYYEMFLDDGSKTMFPYGERL
jgi:hypothetical protein